MSLWLQKIIVFHFEPSFKLHKLYLSLSSQRGWMTTISCCTRNRLSLVPLVGAFMGCGMWILCWTLWWLPGSRWKVMLEGPFRDQSFRVTTSLCSLGRCMNWSLYLFRDLNRHWKTSSFLEAWRWTAEFDITLEIWKWWPSVLLLEGNLTQASKFKSIWHVWHLTSKNWSFSMEQKVNEKGSSQWLLPWKTEVLARQIPVSTLTA